jgi:hypothetical protein
MMPETIGRDAATLTSMIRIVEDSAALREPSSETTIPSQGPDIPCSN